MLHKQFAEREAQILKQLLQQSPITRKQLDQGLGIPHSSVERLLSSLRSKGLVRLSTTPSAGATGYSVVVNLVNAEKAQLEIEDIEEAGTRLKIAYGLLERAEKLLTKELARTCLGSTEVSQELGISQERAKRLIKAAKQSQN